MKFKSPYSKWTWRGLFLMNFTDQCERDYPEARLKLIWHKRRNINPCGVGSEYSIIIRSTPYMLMPQWLKEPSAAMVLCRIHRALSSMSTNLNFLCHLSVKELYKTQVHIDGFVQERHNSIANAMELRLSCTNPSIFLFLEIKDSVHKGLSLS